MAENRQWLKWVGIGCGGAVLLMVVLGGGLFLLVRSATAAPEQVVRSFLDAAAGGDYAAAHAHFSVPLQQVQPLETFTEAAKANSTLFDVTDVSFTNRSVDTSGAELAGTVTLRVGTEMPASFKLVRENDVWKLISYNIGSKN